MNQNPYAPPQAGAPVELIGRKRWIAVVLALIAPPVGMLYVVRPVRALVYLAVGILLVPGTILYGLHGIGDPGVAAIALTSLWRLVGAIEAYRLARRWEGATLPWYSRPHTLVGVLATLWVVVGSLRAFVWEPFRIPAGSMQPTLRVGDHIYVDKRAYGWDVPLTERRIMRFGSPQRGDIAVFRYPPDPQLHYVFRVIGLPGEVVSYTEKKRLIIDGREQPANEDGPDISGLARYTENLGDVSHGILLDQSAPPLFPAPVQRDFPHHDQCRYGNAGLTCKVPVGHYFVMGDNRDNASDSRFWGFVPEDHFIGRARVIWYSRDQNRAGTKPQ